jgi:hypothetical protein
LPGATEKGRPEAVVDDASLNLVLQTHQPARGHQPCPNLDSKKHPAREFTIVDHNGIHTRQIQFCKCARTDFRDWEQLVAVRLFPATFKHPQTAFSFTAMKEFHIHSLASKKSAYDYVKALCKLTDNVRPQSVTVSFAYRVFDHKTYRPR